MHLSYIDWAIIAAYFVISLVIGLLYKKEASQGMSSFFLGGRNLPWYIAGISMVATTFAADTPLAITELVAKNGVSGNWLWWSFLIGGMLTTFFFARLWRRADILTELEFIELRYSGKPAKFLRGFKAIYLGLFMNCIIIAWVNLALNSILRVFFDIPADLVIWYTAGAMLITVIYTSLSGLKGVAMTDTIQFIIAMTGCIVLAIIVLNSDKIGGMTHLKKTLPKQFFNFFPQIGSKGSTATLTLSIGAFLSFIGMQWWASWYPGSEPGGGGYIAQRMMSTKTEKDSFFATLLFQASNYCLRPWPWILVALCAVALYNPTYNHKYEATFSKIEQANLTTKAAVFKKYPQLKAKAQTDKDFNESLSFYYNPRMGYVYAMRDFLPIGFKGLLLVAFFAAYMSTISTQINWGASYLINDFYMRFFRSNHSQKTLVNAGRIASVFIMLFGLYITTIINSISGVWYFILECGAGLGLVLILRWYWWRINAWTEISATIAPFVFYSLLTFVFEPFLAAHYPTFSKTYTYNHYTYILTTILTTATWLIVMFATKPTKKEHLQQFYDKIKPQGNWSFITGKGFSINNFTSLLLCWIFSVIFIYGILFCTGSLLFLNMKEMYIYLGICIVSFIGLRYFMIKSGAFKD